MKKGSYLYKEMSRYRIKLVVIFAVLLTLFTMDSVYRWPYIKTGFVGPTELDVARFISDTGTITIDEPVVLDRRERTTPTAEYLKKTSYWQGDVYSYKVKLDSVQYTGKSFKMKQKPAGAKEAKVDDMYKIYTANVGGRKVAVLAFADQEIVPDMVASLVYMERPILAALSETVKETGSVEISKYVVDVRELEMEAASSDYMFFWVWIVLLLVFLARIASYYIKPKLTPTYKQLYKYGDTETVAKEINNQVEAPETYRDGNKIVTKDYILKRDWFKLSVARNHMAKH